VDRACVLVLTAQAKYTDDEIEVKIKTSDVSTRALICPLDGRKKQEKTRKKPANTEQSVSRVRVELVPLDLLYSNRVECQLSGLARCALSSMGMTWPGCTLCSDRGCAANKVSDRGKYEQSGHRSIPAGSSRRPGVCILPLQPG
jgi:hypothetical protein